MWTSPLLRRMRAWRRDTFLSVRRIVLPSLRPIVISSRIKGTTVVFPSSSWITSLNIVRCVPRGNVDLGPTSHKLYQVELRQNNRWTNYLFTCSRRGLLDALAGQRWRVVDRPRQAN